MGSAVADVANLQSMDEDFLRQPAADRVSLLAAGVRFFDFTSGICAGTFAVVLGNGASGHRIRHPVFPGRGFFVVRGESGVWDSAVSAGIYLVACADVVVDHATGLLGVFGRGVWGLYGGRLAEIEEV